MKKIIIANWKMNPGTLSEAEDLLNFIDETAGDFQGLLVICPPFVYLEDIGRLLKTSRLSKYTELGAQDTAPAEAGAWTGEVSGRMLKRLGARYVIVGHSERRWKIGESDEVTNKKLKTTLANELTAVVCLGEKIHDRSAKDFLKQQTATTFDGLSVDEISKCLIAYEPFWAVSSNRNSAPDTPESALEAINCIRDSLDSKFSASAAGFLYGGSVDSSNASDFLSKQEISGVLVGGASLDRQEFVKILKIGSL